MSLLHPLIASIGHAVTSPHSPLAHYLILYFFVFFLDLAGIQLVEEISSPARSSKQSLASPRPYPSPLLSSMRKDMSRTRPPRTTDRSLGLIRGNPVVVDSHPERTLGRRPKSSDLRAAARAARAASTVGRSGMYPEGIVAELVPLPLHISSTNRPPYHGSFSARLGRRGGALARALETTAGGERRYDVVNVRCAERAALAAEDVWLTPEAMAGDVRASLAAASLLDYPTRSDSAYDVELDELEKLSKDLESATDAATAVQDIDVDAVEQGRIRAVQAGHAVAPSTDGESTDMKPVSGAPEPSPADDESDLLPPTPPLPFSLPERTSNRAPRSTVRSAAEREAMVQWSAAGRTWSIKKALAQWAADVEARKQQAKVGSVAEPAWEEQLWHYEPAHGQKEQRQVSGDRTGKREVKLRQLRPLGIVVVDEEQSDDETQEEWEELVKKMHRELLM